MEPGETFTDRCGKPMAQETRLVLSSVTARHRAATWQQWRDISEFGKGPLSGKSIESLAIDSYGGNHDDETEETDILWYLNFFYVNVPGCRRGDLGKVCPVV